MVLLCLLVHHLMILLTEKASLFMEGESMRPCLPRIHTRGRIISQQIFDEIPKKKFLVKQATMDFIPEDNSDYNTVDYWNTRFATEDKYEWCKSYSSFQSIFNKHVPKTDSILIVGNGNSHLPIDLYNDSYSSITSLDYAENSIKKLQLKAPSEISFVCADMRFMKLDRKFDTVIEKGTLDVLFTKESSPWTISEQTSSDLKGTLSSIKECLNDNGKFISVTFAEPFFRKKHYSEYWKDITVETFGDMFHYYFILCRS